MSNLVHVARHQPLVVAQKLGQSALVVSAGVAVLLTAETLLNWTSDGAIFEPTPLVAVTSAQEPYSDLQEFGPDLPATVMNEQVDGMEQVATPVEDVNQAIFQQEGAGELSADGPERAVDTLTGTEIPELQVATADLAASMAEDSLQETNTQTEIEFASDVSVYRPDARFSDANPEALQPPVPAERSLRPTLEVYPASVVAMVPARTVSIDPMLSDEAVGNWPRRLDQVNARDQVEQLVANTGNPTNLFLMDWKEIQTPNGPKLVPQRNVGN